MTLSDADDPGPPAWATTPLTALRYTGKSDALPAHADTWLSVVQTA